MKNLKPNSFLAGIIFSMVIFLLFAFKFTDDYNYKSLNLKSLPIPPEVVKIGASEAISYRQNYETLYPDDIKGLNISVEQWKSINETVNDLNNDLKNISGFRLYFGSKTRNPGESKIAVVYTLNNSITENEPAAMVNMAQGFDEKFSQQCPPFCD